MSRGNEIYGANFGRTSLFATTACLTLLIVNLPGCGEESDGLPREAVSGTVTLDGQPLAEGSIQMLPVNAKDGQTGGAIIKNGKYSIPRSQGLVPGTYNVTIDMPSLSGAAPDSGPPGPMQAADLPKNLIPAEYNTRSALTAEAKAVVSQFVRFRPQVEVIQL